MKVIARQKFHLKGNRNISLQGNIYIRINKIEQAYSSMAWI